MKATQKLHQAKLCEWSLKISDQVSSGLTVPLWCEQNHVSIHAYNYWKHLLKQEAIDQVLPDIVPLPLSPSEQSLSNTPTQEISKAEPAPKKTDCANRAIQANCTNGSKASLTVNGTTIEIDDSISEAFLTTILRAVRYA